MSLSLSPMARTRSGVMPRIAHNLRSPLPLSTPGAVASISQGWVRVIDKEGVVRYLEVAKELGSEPDYEAALNAAKGLL